MELDEAIATIEARFSDPGAVPLSHFKQACRLGIEALKRLLVMRSYLINQAIMPLPSERPIEDMSPSAERKRRLRESPLGREPKG